MKITTGAYGPDIEIQVTRKMGTKNNLRITTDRTSSTINVCASGDLSPTDARTFARAILLAVELVEGEIEIS